MTVLGWNVDIVSDEHHGPVKRHLHDAVVFPLFYLKTLICSCQYLFFSGSIISTMRKKSDTYILEDVGMDTARNNLLPDKDGFFRMRARHGTPKAITATAHKLARIIFHLIKTGKSFDETVFAEQELLHKQRVEINLKKHAKSMGFELVPVKS